MSSISRCCPVTADVTRAADELRAGGLVAFATETVYGLGANALDEAAVARVFAVKNRPRFDPLIVHIADETWLPRLVTQVPEPARRLIKAFWPGPLTLVLPKTERVPDLVTAGLPAVAVRMPSHPQARDLLRQVDLPIAAPSANPFGQLSPTTAAHVAESLGDRIDLILDGGPCLVGVESTVVLISDGRCTLLRHGGVSQEAIEEIVGPLASGQVPGVTADGDDGAAPPGRPVPSPGMLPQHYAPRTPLSLIGDVDLSTLAGRRLGALVLRSRDLPDGVPFAAVEVLSESGDLTEAAAKFFAAQRRLDSLALDRILAWPFPEEGLGRALNDRLRRAAHE